MKSKLLEKMGLGIAGLGFILCTNNIIQTGRLNISKEYIKSTNLEDEIHNKEMFGFLEKNNSFYFNLIDSLITKYPNYSNYTNNQKDILIQQSLCSLETSEREKVYSELDFLKKTTNYMIYSKKRQKKEIDFILEFLFCSLGTSIFVKQYHKRREKEKKENNHPYFQLLF